tara:strand:- start:110 stop:1321 length:1212 start_codon:yes stop_codon:yes gene_type:complete
MLQAELLKNKKIKNCRLCNSSKFIDIFSIGDMYINDFPPTTDLKGRNGKCPLDLILCEFCELYQLRHTAPQELMYKRHYWYKSGINQTIKNDLKEISRIALDIVKIEQSNVVLDIGANDGTLLKYFDNSAVRVGCEPATNLINDLKSNCEFLINEFWDSKHYKNLSLPKAKIITAIGMFYDMEDPNQFIKDAVEVLDSNGVFIAQLMTLKPMLETNDLGNICHEHLEYYTYSSLKYLFENNGLEIFKIEENQINGGSYRIFARHFDKGSIEWDENISQDDVMNFKKRIDKNKLLCLEYIKLKLFEGKKIYVYGASTKGNTILQYYGLSSEHILGAADKNEEKWGSYTLTDIPIVSEQEARENADIFLVLPYGFINEFVEREKSWLEAGGEFIVPLPIFRTIGE